jgi:hypothetical protein
MDGRALLARPIGGGQLIHLVQRRPDALEGEVELVVRRIEVVEDGLQGWVGIDVVTDAKQESVGNIDEDGHFVQVVPDR